MVKIFKNRKKTERERVDLWIDGEVEADEWDEVED